MQDEHRKFIEKKRDQYKKIGRVFCVALKEWVSFNSKGFYHLKYNGLGKERSKDQQIMRTSLIFVSKKIITNTQVITSNRKIISKSGQVTEYWSLEESVDRKLKVVVILRRVGTGEIIFYSNWKKLNKKSATE